jgi:hypothetical protein
MAVERMHDDRRPCVAREQRRDAADRAGLRRVRVQDLRPLRPDEPRQVPHGEQVVQRGDLAREMRQRHDARTALLRDVRHRLLAVGE